MEYKIKELVYSFFRNVPDSAQMRALRTELTRSMIRRYYDFISSGKTPGEAYNAIISCSQEIKDRIADVMRNMHVTHAPPPFNRQTTTRNNTNKQYADHDNTKSRKGTQKPHAGNVQADKPAKKTFSIPTAAVITLAGAALVVFLACSAFIITQSVFFNSRRAQITDTPLTDENSANITIPNSSQDMEIGKTLVLGNVAQGYRSVMQSFSQNGAYTIEAAYLSTVDHLELRWPAGTVQVSVYDGSDFLVSESAADGILESQALCCGLEGGTLFIQYCTPEAAHSPLPVKNLELFIPRSLSETALDCFMELYDAQLTMDGLTFCSGEIQARDGSINIQNLISSGPLVIETVSADTFLSGTLEDVIFTSRSGSFDFHGGDALCCVEAQTQSGVIDINANLHRVKITEGSGNVRVYAPICPYEMEICTQSGNVFLYLPVKSDFTLDFHSSSGNFISALTVVEARGCYIRGDGIAYFSVNTASGDLQIYEFTPNT